MPCRPLRASTATRSLHAAACPPLVVPLVALLVALLGAPPPASAESLREWGERALRLQSHIDDQSPLAHTTWVGTHNSFANPDDDSLLDYNQPISLRDQLRAGAREIVFDVHYTADESGQKAMRLCHNGNGDECVNGITGNRKLYRALDDIKAWLRDDGNTDQVVLLKLELSDSARRNINKIENKIDNHLGDYVYRTDSPGIAHGDLDTDDDLGCTALPVTSLTKRQVLDASRNVIILTSHTCISDGGFNGLVFYGSDKVDNVNSLEKLAAKTDRDRIMYRVKDATTNKGILGKGSPSLMSNTVRDWLEGGLNIFEMYGYRGGDAYQVGIGSDGATVQPEDMVWSWKPYHPSLADIRKSRDCAVVQDGLIVELECEQTHPIACLHPTSGWVLGDAGAWTSGFAACPQSATFRAPVNAVERRALATLMTSRRAARVWINYSDMASEGEWFANAPAVAYHDDRRWRSTPIHGGRGGTWFDDFDLMRDDIHRERRRLVKVEISAGNRVDKLRFTYSDGTERSHGHKDINSVLELGPGEFIEKVKVCVGTHNGSERVFYVQFWTDSGRRIAGGTSTSDCAEYIWAERAVFGVRGRAGTEIDAISFYFRAHAGADGKVSNAAVGRPRPTFR